MEYKTLEEHIQEVEILLSQVSGVSVQNLTEPRIAKFITEAFDIAFKKAWWAQFNHWQLVSLDGTTGIPTSDSDFWEFGDIKAIYPSTRQVRLTRLPQPFNPFLLTGTQAQFVEPMAGKKLFRIWPMQSTDQLYVNGRKKPDDYPFSLTNEIPMDDIVLQNIAAWSYCVGDGNNPAEAERFQVVFDQRIKTLLGEEIGNIPMQLDPNFVDIPNEWMPVP
jgi:hypothetical protein